MKHLIDLAPYTAAANIAETCTIDSGALFSGPISD